ncbi:phage tail tape measure protein [Priestia abyssalis]|uniref:phage tail tape measure protein n=1 Tax=Priestia abyssalis TaxID=1221450 RepID=UPI0011178043|nr:phage tail tape measure protein [Priestia abyssalis]
MQKTKNDINDFKNSSVASFNAVAASAAGLAAVGIAGFGTAVASEVVQMESAFSRLQAKTGATGKELKGLQSTVKEVFAGGFGESVGQVSGDIATLNSMFSDLNKSQMKTLAEGAYTISDLWGAEVKEVGKTVKTMTATFKGLSETDAMDLVTTAFKKTGDYSDDLLDTFNEYSVYFEKLGFDAKGFTNVLVKGAEAGAFTMDKAADAIKEFGIRSIDASETTADGFKLIGLDAEKMTNNFATGVETAQQAFAATMAGLATMKDPVKQNAAGVALFGTQWEDLRETVVLAMSDGTDAVGNFKGATAEATASMQDNFGTKMLKAWRELKLGIAEVFTDNGGKEFLSDLADAAMGFSKAVRENGDVIQNVAIGLGTFVGVLGAVKTGVALVAGAQWLWNAAMAANPTFWVVTGISALIAIGVVLYRNWDTISAKGSALWSNVKGKFGDLKNNVVNWFGEMKNSGTKKFNEIVEGAKALPGKIGSGIKGTAKFAIAGIDYLGNMMIGGLARGINGVTGGINWVLGKIGVEKKIPEWKPKKYAKGTNYHPGGLAIVGDGGGPELIRTPNGQIGLSPSTDTLVNLPSGTEVLPHRETQMLLASGMLPAYKNGTDKDGLLHKASSFVNGAVDKVKDMTLDVWSYLSNPSALMGKVYEKFIPEMPSINGVFGDILSGSISMIKEKAIGFVKKKMSDFGSLGNFKSGIAAPSQVKAWISQALAITGTPMSWMPAMLIKAQKESGFNPRAINLWDINAKRGTPSKGLFQTIDPTFNAYKMKGMNDIWNPVHNAVAAIRYIKDRYGTVFNTPGIKSMMRGGAYRGYRKGGFVPSTQTAWVGEEGPELVELPGGSRVHNHRNSMRMTNGNGTVNYFTININGNKSVNEILNELIPELKKRLANI